MSEEFEIQITEDLKDERLDLYLKNNPDLKLSRSYIQELISNQRILVNSKPSKASYRLSPGDVINLNIPIPELLKVEPENIPLDIIFEDDELIVINKSPNMATHPAPHNYSGTLVNAIMHHVIATGSKLSDINGILRPGIVHRLDKDTSGLIIVAKSNEAHQSLALQISQRTCLRLYTTLVFGKMASIKATNPSPIKKQFASISENLSLDDICGFVDEPIGRDPKFRQRMSVNGNGRSARTYWQLLKSYRFASKDFSLLECKLETGRTHQIRVHLSHIKHPIVGDSTYSKLEAPFNTTRPLLHSSKVQFVHPKTNELIKLEAPLPKDFQYILGIISPKA